MSGCKKPRKIVSGHVERLISILGPVCKSIDVCGSFRRGDPLIGDIDLIVIDPNGGFDGVIEEIRKEYSVTIEPKDCENMVRTRIYISGHGIKNLEVDVWITQEEFLGSAKLHCTGPGMFNVMMRKYARTKGLEINFFGVTDSDGKVIASRTEEECFKALGWKYIPPEKRSNWKKATALYTMKMRLTNLFDQIFSI